MHKVDNLHEDNQESTVLPWVHWEEISSSIYPNMALTINGNFILLSGGAK